MKMNFILIFVIFLISHLYSQSEPLITDRPDQTESSTIVPKGTLQIETGTIYEKDEPGESISLSSLSLATTLLRWGITNSMELRLGSAYTRETLKNPLNKNENNGMDAVDLGLKYALRSEQGKLPEMALILNAAIPTEEADENIVPMLLLAMSHSLNESVGIGYNLGGEFGDHFQFIYSAAVGIGLTQNTSAFLEFYGTVEEHVTNVLFDTGLTWLAKSNLQFDTSIGMAINEEAPDYFINGGISLRLPH